MLQIYVKLIYTKDLSIFLPCFFVFKKKMYLATPIKTNEEVSRLSYKRSIRFEIFLNKDKEHWVKGLKKKFCVIRTHQMWSKFRWKHHVLRKQKIYTSGRFTWSSFFKATRVLQSKSISYQPFSKIPCGKFSVKSHKEKWKIWIFNFTI